MNERNTSLGRRWRPAVLVAGYYYIGCYTLLYWFLHGAAISGEVSNGRYYVNFHSYMTEVDEWLYWVSYVAFFGVPVSVISVFFAALSLSNDEAKDNDSSFGSYLLDHELHDFRLVFRTKRQLWGALLVVPVAVFLTIFAGGMVVGIVASIVRGIFQWSISIPLWVFPFAFISVAGAIAFGFSACYCIFGLTTRITAHDGQVNVFQGFGRLGWTRSMRIGSDMSVSLPKGKPGLPRGTLGLIEIRSGDRTIRIGRYLDTQQKTTIVDVLRTEIEHVVTHLLSS